MILFIDNYDSFVYNLVRYVTQLGYASKVVRNDDVTIDEITRLNPNKIIISPGPCDPIQAGISLEVIIKFGQIIPIFGVCLGHQAIAQAYGAHVMRAKKPMHGKASLIQHNGQSIFSGLTSPLKVGRYHSLVVSKDGFPDILAVMAESNDGEIMALRHKVFPVYGVQFHPESVLTEKGYDLLTNFMMTG